MYIPKSTRRGRGREGEKNKSSKTKMSGKTTLGCNSHGQEWFLESCSLLRRGGEYFLSSLDLTNLKTNPILIRKSNYLTFWLSVSVAYWLMVHSSHVGNNGFFELNAHECHHNIVILSDNLIFSKYSKIKPTIFTLFTLSSLALFTCFPPWGRIYFYFFVVK